MALPGSRGSLPGRPSPRLDTQESQEHTHLPSQDWTWGQACHVTSASASSQSCGALCLNLQLLALGCLHLGWQLAGVAGEGWHGDVGSVCLSVCFTVLRMEFRAFTIDGRQVLSPEQHPIPISVEIPVRSQAAPASPYWSPVGLFTYFYSLQ